MCACPGAGEALVEAKAPPAAMITERSLKITYFVFIILSFIIYFNWRFSFIYNGHGC